MPSDIERSRGRSVACPLCDERMLTPAAATESSAPTLGPLCRKITPLIITPLVFRNRTLPAPPASRGDLGKPPKRSMKELPVSSNDVHCGALLSDQAAHSRGLIALIYFKRTVTPPTAADTSAPTLGPLSCNITPLAFCN